MPQRRRTDLDLRPSKNVAGLVAAAQGLPHCYGRNRRGKWVLYDQVSPPTPSVSNLTSSHAYGQRLMHPVPVPVPVPHPGCSCPLYIVQSNIELAATLVDLV